MLQWRSICFVKQQKSSEELLQNIAKKFVHRIICLLTILCVVLLTGILPVEISQASLSTYNDQSVSFKVLKDGRYVINVEDSGKFEGNGRQFKTISSCLYLVMITGKVKKNLPNYPQWMNWDIQQQWASSSLLIPVLPVLRRIQHSQVLRGRIQMLRNNYWEIWTEKSHVFINAEYSLDLSNIFSVTIA